MPYLVTHQKLCRRRELIRGCRAGKEKTTGRLFPSGLKGSQWNTFQAAGYAKDVSGICYRTKTAGYFTCYVDKLYPCSGMPLGGIDTGALYLEPSGVLGYTSIFNHLTPIGGPLNVPYLGVASGGRSWVCGTAQTKNYAGNNRATMGLKVLGSMQESEYWGHYPIADIEYKSDAPVQIGVRCWSPFIPGRFHSLEYARRCLRGTPQKHWFLRAARLLDLQLAQFCRP